MERTPFSVAEPELAKFWHPSLNGSLTPADVHTGSHNQVWLQCPLDSTHVWKKQVRHFVTAVDKCPFCALEANSLATLFPDVAKEWHPTKNEMGADKVAGRAALKAWWQCAKDPAHEWQTQVKKRTTDKNGCPICARLPNDSNSLAKLLPELAAQWHPKNNGALRLDQVKKGSQAEVWWRCTANEKHEWQARVASRTKNKVRCPFCPKALTDRNRLSTVCPEVAAEWHPTKNRRLWPSWASVTSDKEGGRGRNRKLGPEDFSIGSPEYAWWQCQKNKDHVWYAQIVRRVIEENGCPYCAGKKAAPDNCLATKYPALAKMWHPRRNMPWQPTEVTPGSGRKVWWRCFKSPEHVWQAKIFLVVRQIRKGQRGCPFCSNRKLAPSKSLASQYPALVQSWVSSRNLPLKPQEVRPVSKKRVWWRCARNASHVYRCGIYVVVDNYNNGKSACPQCRKESRLSQSKKVV